MAYLDFADGSCKCIVLMPPFFSRIVGLRSARVAAATKCPRPTLIVKGARDGAHRWWISERDFSATVGLIMDGQIVNP